MPAAFLAAAEDEEEEDAECDQQQDEKYGQHDAQDTYYRGVVGVECTV